MCFFLKNSYWNLATIPQVGNQRPFFHFSVGGATAQVFGFPPRAFSGARGAGAFRRPAIAARAAGRPRGLATSSVPAARASPRGRRDADRCAAFGVAGTAAAERRVGEPRLPGPLLRGGRPALRSPGRGCRAGRGLCLLCAVPVHPPSGPQTCGPLCILVRPAEAPPFSYMFYELRIEGARPWEHHEARCWCHWGDKRFSATFKTLFICLGCTRSSLQHAGSSVAACGIEFPDQGSNPGRLHWGCGGLATGSPEKSLEWHLRKESSSKALHLQISAGIPQMTVQLTLLHFHWSQFMLLSFLSWLPNHSLHAERNHFVL